MVGPNKELQVITPDWPAPAYVKALVTTRQDGVSQTPFDSFNVGLHVGDNPEHVQKNRQQLQQYLNTACQPQWLQQVHGSEAVAAQVDGIVREADACFTDSPSLPCAVMTADCLPVFFCAQQGDKIAVAHAGWRGLAEGVLETTIGKLGVPPAELLVWLGPAIGPEKFEVGDDVRTAFMAISAASAEAFKPQSSKPGHWLADIYQLARLRLNQQGVDAIYGSNFCTYSDTERFFSYRRDGVTGRMASVIWMAP